MSLEMQLASKKLFVQAAANLICDLCAITKTHILGVRQLLAVPSSENSSQFGAIFELSHPSQMEILPGGDGLASQINNLEGNQHIVHISHSIRYGFD